MEYITFAHQLADAAGAIARHYFRQGGYSLDFKGDHSPVTQADLAIETALRELIAQHYPSHGICAEEYPDKVSQSSYCWVLDPIDGTAAFASGKPSFTTLIALWKGNKPLLGIIDQPITQERWVGQPGHNTLLNQDVCASNALQTLAQARLSCTTPDMFGSEESDQLFKLIKANVGLISHGGDAYAYGLLAAGHLDIIVEASLKFYDVAALVPIIEGAGGIITDWQGNKIDASFKGQCIACGNKRLWLQVMSIVSGKPLLQPPPIHY